MGGPRRRGASDPSLYPPASAPRSPAWSGLVPGLTPASSSDLPPPHPLDRPRPHPPAPRCIRLPPARAPLLGPASSPAWPPPHPLNRPRPRPRSDPRSDPRSAMWLCTDQSCPPVTNVARNSPPDISNFEMGPLELQRLWAISKNDRVKLRATFGRDPPTTHEPLPRPDLTHPGYPKMSHVIPLHIFQTLKSDRWNCNVCGPSRKMTELNYVRLLLGRLPPSLSVPSTDNANRDQD